MELQQLYVFLRAIISLREKTLLCCSESVHIQVSLSSLRMRNICFTRRARDLSPAGQKLNMMTSVLHQHLCPALNSSPSSKPQIASFVSLFLSHTPGPRFYCRKVSKGVLPNSRLSGFRACANAITKANVFDFQTEVKTVFGLVLKS